MIRRHLIIVGARGWGREVYASVRGLPLSQRWRIDVRGFLDSDPTALDGLGSGLPPILTSPDDYEPRPGDIFFVALGSPQWRRHYAEMLEGRGAEFMTIVCPGAYVNATARIAPGAFISPWSTIASHTQVGRHAMVHSFTTIGHDVRLGGYSSVEPYVFVGGEAQIGDETFLHTRCTIVKGCKVGRRVDVGAGSLVIRDLRDGIHVFGSPAAEVPFFDD